MGGVSADLFVKLDISRSYNDIHSKSGEQCQIELERKLSPKERHGVMELVAKGAKPKFVQQSQTIGILTERSWFKDRIFGDQQGEKEQLQHHQLLGRMIFTAFGIIVTSRGNRPTGSESRW